MSSTWPEGKGERARIALTNQRPSPAAITNDGVRDFYRNYPWERYWLQYLAPDFLPTRLSSRQRCETVMLAIRRSRGDRFTVVDLGCGIGLYAIALCRRFRNARVVAVDISHQQLVTGRALAERAGVADRISFLCADAVRLPLRQTFDVVICSELLERFPEPGPVLEQARGLAAEGTQLLFSVPHRYGTTDHSGIIYRQVLEDGSIRECLSADQLLPGVPAVWFYHRLFDGREAEALLRSAGLEPLQPTFSGFAPPWSGHRQLRTLGLLESVMGASQSRSSRLARAIDSLVNRAFGNRHAANIIISARVARGESVLRR